MSLGPIGMSGPVAKDTPKVEVMYQHPWDLAITPDQFRTIYGEAVDIRLFMTDPQSDNELMDRYLCSKLWRLNNLYMIVDKDGIRVPFRMNYAQHRVYAASLEHPRLIILKSRQQGISTFWLVSFLDDGLFIADLSIGLMAQGKSEAATLLKRAHLSWETFPPEIKEFLTQALVRNNTEELSFANGATVFIRTSFRSATLQRLHISEYGKIANSNPGRAKETKTGTLQAIRPGNTVVIESTAEGDNDFKVMWLNALDAEAKVARLGLPAFAGKDFKPVFLSWLDDPDCTSDHEEHPSLIQIEYFEALEAKTGHIISIEQRNFWVAQYRELGEAIYQEYPATWEEAFTKVHDGAYYGPKYHQLIVRKDRIISGLYDENLPVYVMMDLGMNDEFVLLYFQKWQKEWRIIDEYMNTGEGLEFYVAHMDASPYTIKTVYGPHDLNVKELGTNMTRKARLRELGVMSLVVLPRSPLLEGIEKVRTEMSHMYVDEKCTYMRGCLQNYSKEWDEKLGVWKAKPRHDKWSHGADTIRGMVQSNAKHVANELRRSHRNPSGVADGMAF
jgi:hypothetical protein